MMDCKDFLILTIGTQIFGIPTSHIQDIFRPQEVYKIPLAPPEIAGAMNLRGRIIIVVDMRKRLGFPVRKDKNAYVHVIIKKDEELYSLMFDEVGDVLDASVQTIQAFPIILDRKWKKLSKGVCQQKNKTLVILDVNAVLDLAQ